MEPAAAPVATCGGGSCPVKDTRWGAPVEVVEIPAREAAPTADTDAAGAAGTAGAAPTADTGAAGCAQADRGAGATPGAACTADTGAAGAAPTADTSAAAAAPMAAATGGPVVEDQAERGSLPGSSSQRWPPPRGMAEGRWRGWYDEKRWKWVAGQWLYRSYGEGPETGGHDCPQSRDPKRTERNKRRKAKKDRKREEREADTRKAEQDAWRREYERRRAAGCPHGRLNASDSDDGTESSQGSPPP